jgi:hypothetical protein
MLYIFTLIKSNILFIFLLICILLFFIISSIIYYLLIKILQIDIDFNNIFFYQYNKKCKLVLEKYGNYKIQQLYLVRQPFGNIVSLAFNILTCFQYNKYLQQSKNNYPYHPALIFQIKTSDNFTKFILLEKNNCINLCETFLINKNYQFLPIPLNKKNKLTIKQILNSTEKRIGIKSYFNWNICKNNCQEFTKQILLTLNVYNYKYKEFIFSDKIIQLYKPSEFTLHIINCLFIIMNFFEKYILNNDFFL